MNDRSRDQKIADIQKRLNLLFCFSSEEIDAYLEKIPYFSDAGLEDFLDFLAEAEAEQQKFFAETLKRDPTFAQKFSRFLKQTSTNLKNEFELKQQAKADDILKKIT